MGFQAKVIGFSDSLAGMQGRSVWTDENGDKVYLTQPELYRLGLLTTFFCLLVFLATGTPWLILLAR